MRNNKVGVVLTILLGVLVVVIIVILSVGNARLQTQVTQLQHDRDLLESQKVGPQGPNPTSAQILKAVETYCDSHDGCRGPQGVVGQDGKSIVGARGATGAAGDSVASVRCNGTSVSFLDAGGKVLGTVGLVCLK